METVTISDNSIFNFVLKSSIGNVHIGISAEIDENGEFCIDWHYTMNDRGSEVERIDESPLDFEIAAFAQNCTNAVEAILRAGLTEILN